MWLRIFRAPHAAEAQRGARAARVCAATLAIAAGVSPSQAQAPRSPTAAPRPAARAAARPPAITLEPVLEVALDAQPAAPAAFDAGGAYLPLKGGRLVAVDLASGAVRWAVDLETVWSPSVDQGVVIVAADELLTALDSKTGRPMWRVPVTGGLSAPPVIRGGWVAAASREGELFFIRAADGMVMWNRALGVSASARPVIAASGVYVPLANGRVVALDATTGAVRWERALGGQPGELLVLEEHLFTGADDKHFYSIDPSDGDVRWKQRVGGRPAGRPAADAKRVYYVALDNILWAFDRNNGGRKWHEPLPVRPSGGPLVAGDVVFVAGVAAEVLAYRAETGISLGKASAPADLASAPQLIPSDVPVLTSIALVTRAGVFMLVGRRIEPPITALPQPLGTPIPLSALDAD